MTVTRQLFAQAARSYLGTPFRHMGRTPRIGLDCVGVVVCAAREAGAPLDDFLGYGFPAAPGTLAAAARDRLDAIEVETAGAGDIAMFRSAGESPAHLCVMDGRLLIHACAHTGRVVEHPWSRAWERRLVGFWRLREVG